MAKAVKRAKKAATRKRAADAAPLATGSTPADGAAFWKQMDDVTAMLDGLAAEEASDG